VERNVADDNDLDGIAIPRTLSGTARLAGNRTDRNGDDGIDVDGVQRYLGELEWAPGPQPVFSDEGGVWLVNPDGSGLRRLTDGTWPSWSRDGERLACSDDGLYVIDADGTNRRRISELSGFQYGWSPDDTEIAFWGGGTNQTSDVFAARVDGGALRQVTATALAQERHPTWSPDGSRLALTSVPSFDPTGENEDVYVVNADGTGLTQVTTSTHRDIDPHWSPDGSMIAFLRKTGGTPHDEEWSLFVVRPDGTGERKLADAGVGAGGWEQLSWAPDGSRIAFLRDGDVYTIAPDGTGERRISMTPAEEADPEWSPGGGALAFRVRDDTGQKVQVVSATGTPIGVAALPIVTLARNVADRNSDLGIEAVAAIDGGANRARRNGDPRQCTGVTCDG
jgi:Tol biopolymer transport system component